MSKLENYRIFERSTIRHLRFPFSFFLLPVFLFALSQAETVDWTAAVLAFFILHFLLFPSSNAYNSYQDRDEGSIGGLKHPPQVTRNLYVATIIFDILALAAGMFISTVFSILLLVFIIMSKLYSYRAVRLKKYPVAGYLTVFIFQGGFVYFMSALAISGQSPASLLNAETMLCMAISSFFIGSVYPLTQIYQHESDRNDGVVSISYMLGYRGTFIFSGLMFAAGALLMTYYFWSSASPLIALLFLPFIIPMAFKMSGWFRKVRKDLSQANYENTMSMNMISSVSMNLYFITLIVISNISGG